MEARTVQKNSPTNISSAIPIPIFVFLLKLTIGVKEEPFVLYSLVYDFEIGSFVVSRTTDLDG